jgi:TonB family protein
MRRNLPFGLAVLVIVSTMQPMLLFCQENSAKESYDGEPLCRNRRGVYPRAVYTPGPEYDAEGRKKKIEGTVTLSVIVTKEGQAADLKVLKTLTPGLDQQAMKTVSRWKFEPVTQDGQACPMRMNLEVSFHLY